MMALRLGIVGLVKLACVAGFVWLALHDRAAYAWPLALLCLLTRFPAIAEAPKASPATRPAPSTAKLAA